MPWLAGAADGTEDLEAGIEAYNNGDLVTAMSKYRAAVSAGSTEALVRLAWIYDQSEDNELAVDLYRQAADLGHPGGEFGIGEMYAKGEGIEKDTAAARQWFERAAAQGHLPALRVLVAAWENGELGLDADAAEAGRWLIRAAEAGDRHSMQRLAGLYRTGGLGIEPDEGLEMQWRRRIDEAGGE